MNIILLGSPASGKGTQAEMLAEKLKLFYFQTGDFSRELAKKDERIKKIVNSGKLIPQGLMTEYVKVFLEKNLPKDKDVLFEGYPRFIPQYKFLQKWMRQNGRTIDYVISLDISEKEAIKRLSSRRVCKECKKTYNLITNPPTKKNTCECGKKLYQRKDDNPESIKIRFQYYRDNTKKLIDYVDKKGLLIRVDGERPIDVIFKDILKKIGYKGK